MVIGLNKSELGSRLIRVNQIKKNFSNLLSNSFIGENTREIGSALRFTDQDNGGGIISKVLNFTGSAIGWLWTGFKSVIGGITGLVSWLRTISTMIVNFDFNASDQALAAAIKANNLTLAGVWGGFLGEVLGSAAAIAVGSFVSVTVGAGINLLLPGIGSALTPALVRGVAAQTIADRIPELIGSLKLAAAQTVKAVMVWTGIKSYVWARRAIKKLFPNNQTIQNWGIGDRWTIAEAMEERIENLTGNQWLNVFFEEVYEEGIEAFWETGYVFARNLEDSLQAAKVTKEEILGPKINQVSIELDPQTDDRVILLDQPSNLAKMQVLSEINQHRRLRNKDIGYFVGEPLEHESRRFNYLRTCKIVFKSVPKPPYRPPNGDKLQTATISLKDLKPNLKWKDFKLALEPFLWGRYNLKATLNRSRQTIQGNFTNADLGTKWFRKVFEELIDDDYISLDGMELLEQNTAIKRPINGVLVYPVEMVITVKKPVIDREDVTHDLAGGKYEKTVKKIVLYTDNEPVELSFDPDFTGYLT